MKPKIGVLGLWHLGCVTAACLAKHNDVVGLDFEGVTVAKLQQGHAPVAEPGLDHLIGEGLASGRLSFAMAAEENVAEIDLLWVTYDTPVDENDRSDTAFVLDRVRRVLDWSRNIRLVVISAQLPVGTCGALEKEYAARGLAFACVPENLRLGQALDVFLKPDRIVAGVRTAQDREILLGLLAPFSEKIIWMTPESAEMTKHALNSFLAVSIAFMNEISRLCERTGADARSVSEGLKSDRRIGPHAYLAPGAAFAGGTLARDVVTLVELGTKRGESIEVLSAIGPSNEKHKLWAWHRLVEQFPILAGRTITLLGLTYKPNTDTLRRSASLELAGRLVQAGARVLVWDPAVPSVPEHPELFVAGSAREAVTDADAVVIGTPWPQFREENWTELLAAMKRPVVLDAGRFLQRHMPAMPSLKYFTVGVPDEA